MARAITVYTTSRITPDGLQAVMTHLKASPDPHGWELARNGRKVFVEITTEDLSEMPEELLAPVAQLLGGWPKSSVVLIYDDSALDEFEGRMARAVAVAMAELWPVVLDDHAGTVETIYPPGQRPDNA